MSGLKILSLFDGMSCGMIALEKAEIIVDRYVAYEIDEYAVKVSNYNYNNIEYKGDVFEGDFTQYKDFDLLIGGSPCTHWSIAQKANREVDANTGLGWDLFKQYLRAIKESKPKIFLYENNKSMSKDIKASISKEFGFEPICINSDLVSAQNRHRLYWVGIRKCDGTYEKVDITQPIDTNVSIDEIIDKSAFTYGIPKRIPSYGNKNKCRPAEALYSNHSGTGFGSIRQRLFSEKSYKQQVDIIAVPISEDVHRSVRDDSKINTYVITNGCLIYENVAYPIDLDDGFYIFRRLSVDEYKRIQTIPDKYDMSVISDGRAYKCLGNGWTVNVIIHILNQLKEYLY